MQRLPFLIGGGIDNVSVMLIANGSVFMINQNGKYILPGGKLQKPCPGPFKQMTSFFIKQTGLKFPDLGSMCIGSDNKLQSYIYNTDTIIYYCDISNNTGIINNLSPISNPFVSIADIIHGPVVTPCYIKHSISAMMKANCFLQLPTPQNQTPRKQTALQTPK